MADAPRPSEAILFDFFGTLVTYEHDFRRVRYAETTDLVRQWMPDLDHDDFVALWDEGAVALETEASQTLREYSMLDVARAWTTTCALDLADEQCTAIAASFLDEWEQHVRVVDGVAEMLRSIAPRCRLGIVSNTHDPDMVHRLLERFDMSDLWELVVLSVECGWRKPHPTIYEEAFAVLDLPAEAVAFVGDSYEADYVGPRACGMAAYLIDPAAEHPIPSSHRLNAVLDVADRVLVDLRKPRRSIRTGRRSLPPWNRSEIERRPR